MSIVRIMEAALNADAGLMKAALEGLTDEDLLKRPSEQTNPIGWLLWHHTRVEDAVISGLAGGSQVWVEGGWHAKFGLEADPRDAGTGHSLDRVKALKPAIDALKGYAAAVREKTLAYLKRLKPADLDADVPTVLGDTRKLGDYLGGFLVDYLHHSGQVFYVRGYISGFGWFPM
ncbi:MAG: DinB family protein [Nitrospinota bacterium]